MNFIKKTISVAMAGLIAVCSLTGCTSADKTKVEETANTFMAIVAKDSTEDINKYATSEVVNGDFVKLFDSKSLVDQFMEGFSSAELTAETNSKIDEFARLFSSMIETYSITDVKIAKDGTATAIATVKTSFPTDIINNEEAQAKINESVTSYYTDNAEEIDALMAEDQTKANDKIYNDIIQIILGIYEDTISSSESMTYAIALDLEKNSETDTYLVTDVKDYDHSTSK
jgi:hypothetical protein